MSCCLSYQRLSAHAIAILLALPLAFATHAKAFTIDFESGFGAPGEPLPDFHPTPVGDVQFTNGEIRANPLSDGAQMASQVSGPVADDESTVFSFMVPASVAEVRLTLVNPNLDGIYVQHFETSFGDTVQDFGAFVPGEETDVLIMEETLGPGADFFGASFDFENRCQSGFDVAACTTNWGIDSIEIVPGPIPAEIDIKPGSSTNRIDPFSREVIPVAIVGSDSFDVADVDVTTLAFGPDGAAPAFDLTIPFFYQLIHRDWNGDGREDLLTFYLTEETGIGMGDTKACLTGETLDGLPFEGCDDITTEPSCGLGAELAFLLPPLIWLYRRRGRRV